MLVTPEAPTVPIHVHPQPAPKLPTVEIRPHMRPPTQVHREGAYVRCVADPARRKPQDAPWLGAPGPINAITNTMLTYI